MALVRTAVLAIVLLLCTFMVAPSAMAQSESLVTWEGIIGIIQAGNVVGSGTGAVIGGGQPWTATGGQAFVSLSTGIVEFSVQGLVLAGGNDIGTRGATNTTVKGTLVCDTNGSAGGGNSVLVDTPLVPYSTTGDASFVGFVNLNPVCRTEADIAFLIRLPVGRWIGAGVVRRP